MAISYKNSLKSKLIRPNLKNIASIYSSNLRKGDKFDEKEGIVLIRLTSFIQFIDCQKRAGLKKCVNIVSLTYKHIRY